MKSAVVRCFFVLSCVLVTVSIGNAQSESFERDELFKSHIRTTEPLTPSQEREKLKVPPGFEVTLFASEPQIQKPLNMAFDADGRLWVTGSNQYPFPSEGESGSDGIYILEDTNHDGRADSVTPFAEDLNIPIGIYPYRDGAIVFSIPNIYFLRDTDGDGRADQRETLYGPFDTTRDTHGMNNAFRRGFDGWLYCCHGFNNQSAVRGRDGHTVRLTSGNTYRIRLDGSRIEHFTHGQVNPFGMTIDANGDLFNSDCHTKPVSLLIRDGFYESFGRPHDGLGFVPNVMEHLHGSTAIDALCQYQGTAFPQDYQDDFFVGNVMTCRVHRDSIQRTGSSIHLIKEPDFLTSEDPWFRPVDIQVGPDGALYVADFYNRIIGHYEVPLNHEGRDRSRGRIWRIAYTGAPESPADSRLNLTSAGPAQLIERLGDARRPVRQHAADQLVDRIGPEAVPLLLKAANEQLTGADQNGLPQILWTLHRIGELTSDVLEQAAHSKSERTRIHALRICGEIDDLDRVEALIDQGLQDESPLAQRAAATAASQHPSAALTREVINTLVVAPADDVHLRHTLRIALRNQLRAQSVVDWFTTSTPPQSAADAVADVIPGLHSPAAGRIVVTLLNHAEFDDDQLANLVQHAAVNSSPEGLDALADLVTELPNDSPGLQAKVWKAMSEALQESGRETPAPFARWSNQLAMRLLSSVDIDEIGWGQYALATGTPVKWGIENRKLEDAQQREIEVISSLPSGETGTGVLRSRSFVLPFSMKVQCCGHSGRPGQPADPGNLIALVDATTGKELFTLMPPRSDSVDTTEWYLAGYAGRRAYLQVQDGMDLNAYAWLAVGRISPPVLTTTEFNAELQDRISAALEILLEEQRNQNVLSPEHIQIARQIAVATQIDGRTRSLAVQLLFAHHGKPELASFADLMQSAATPHVITKLVTDYATTTSEDNESENMSGVHSEFVKAVFSIVNQDLRSMLVQNLARSRDGASLLIDAMEAGTPSAEVLRDERLRKQIQAFGGNFSERVEQLAANLPPRTKSYDEVIERVAQNARLAKDDPSRGQALFAKHCMQCHRVRGQGGIAGPQLDGISTRGTSRLLEDILYPNRNVDVAFRTSTLLLTDGRVLSGIVREAPAPSEIVRVIGNDGKTVEISQNQIEERQDSTLSLMPSGVGELLTEDDLLQLVLWLR